MVEFLLGSNAASALAREVAELDLVQGKGVRILTEAITSPTVAAQLDAILEKWPEAKWITYEPAGRTKVYEGAELAFGQVSEPVYDFTKADVVVAIDSDFLNSGPGKIRYARDFASRREIKADQKPNLNRLYAVESTFSVTGSNAEHRAALKPSNIPVAVSALAHALGVGGSESAELEAHATFFAALG